MQIACDRKIVRTNWTNGAPATSNGFQFKLTMNTTSPSQEKNSAFNQWSVQMLKEVGSKKASKHFMRHHSSENGKKYKQTQTLTFTEPHTLPRDQQRDWQCWWWCWSFSQQAISLRVVKACKLSSASICRLLERHQHYHWQLQQQQQQQKWEQ